LKEVQSAITAYKEKRWQPQSSHNKPQEHSSSSKRHKSSSFRKCENATCSAAAINRPCTRHPKRLMMACRATCHKKAKKQRLNRKTSNLAPLQLQTDTDKANAEIAALTKSKDFPLQAPSQQMHKRAMPEGSLSGWDNSQP